MEKKQDKSMESKDPKKLQDGDPVDPKDPKKVDDKDDSTGGEKKPPFNKNKRNHKRNRSSVPSPKDKGTLDDAKKAIGIDKEAEKVDDKIEDKKVDLRKETGEQIQVPPDSLEKIGGVKLSTSVFTSRTQKLVTLRLQGPTDLKIKKGLDGVEVTQRMYTPSLIEALDNMLFSEVAELLAWKLNTERIDFIAGISGMYPAAQITHATAGLINNIVNLMMNSHEASNALTTGNMPNHLLNQVRALITVNANAALQLVMDQLRGNVNMLANNHPGAPAGALQRIDAKTTGNGFLLSRLMAYSKMFENCENLLNMISNYDNNHHIDDCNVFANAMNAIANQINAHPMRDFNTIFAAPNRLWQIRSLFDVPYMPFHRTSSEGFSLLQGLIAFTTANATFRGSPLGQYMTRLVCSGAITYSHEDTFYSQLVINPNTTPLESLVLTQPTEPAYYAINSEKRNNFPRTENPTFEYRHDALLRYTYGQDKMLDTSRVKHDRYGTRFQWPSIAPTLPNQANTMNYDTSVIDWYFRALRQLRFLLSMLSLTESQTADAIMANHPIKTSRAVPTSDGEADDMMGKISCFLNCYLNAHYTTVNSFKRLSAQGIPNGKFLETDVIVNRPNYLSISKRDRSNLDAGLAYIHDYSHMEVVNVKKLSFNSLIEDDHTLFSYSDYPIVPGAATIRRTIRHYEADQRLISNQAEEMFADVGLRSTIQAIGELDKLTTHYASWDGANQSLQIDSPVIREHIKNVMTTMGNLVFNKGSQTGLFSTEPETCDLSHLDTDNNFQVLHRWHFYEGWNLEDFSGRVFRVKPSLPDATDYFIAESPSIGSPIGYCNGAIQHELNSITSRTRSGVIQNLINALLQRSIGRTAEGYRRHIVIIIYGEMKQYTYEGFHSSRFFERLRDISNESNYEFTVLNFTAGGFTAHNVADITTLETEYSIIRRNTHDRCDDYLPIDVPNWSNQQDIRAMYNRLAPNDINDFSIYMGAGSNNYEQQNTRWLEFMGLGDHMRPSTLFSLLKVHEHFRQNTMSPVTPLANWTLKSQSYIVDDSKHSFRYDHTIRLRRTHTKDEIKTVRMLMPAVSKELDSVRNALYNTIRNLNVDGYYPTFDIYDLEVPQTIYVEQTLISRPPNS